MRSCGRAELRAFALKLQSCCTAYRHAGNGHANVTAMSTCSRVSSLNAHLEVDEGDALHAKEEPFLSSWEGRNVKGS
jgi:hypothetical protein